MCLRYAARGEATSRGGLLIEERRCLECGAPLGDARACEELFHAALAMEWVDLPKTAEARHLLVATCMLQHPSGFTPEARELFAATLIASVDEGLTHQELRERVRRWAKSAREELRRQQS